MYTTYFSLLDRPVKPLIPLLSYKVLQHMITDKVKTILFKPSVIGVHFQATVQIGHFILIITTSRIERLIINEVAY